MMYKADIDLLASMSSEERERFIAWLDVFEETHIAAGRPYGERVVWVMTGMECWVHAFRDGDDPADALAEDLSYADC